MPGRVVLPAPWGPTMAVIPGPRSTSTPSTAVTPPQPLQRARARISGMYDRAHVLAAQRRLEQLGLAPVDDLELLHQAPALEEVEQHLVEGQRRQVAPLQLRR